MSEWPRAEHHPGYQVPMVTGGGIGFPGTPPLAPRVQLSIADYETARRAVNACRAISEITAHHSKEARCRFTHCTICEVKAALAAAEGERNA